MIGITAVRNNGVAVEITISEATTSVEHAIKSAIPKGICTSIKSMSDENRFMILPRGLVSKNCIGLLIMPYKREV